MPEPVLEPLLVVRDLHAYYGESHVLHGVGFDVGVGQTVGLTGRNGAGKSTILKCVMGMLARRLGSVRLRGEELIALPSNQVARKGIAFCPEDRGIFAGLTVYENLMLPPVVAAGGMDIEAIYTLFPNLRGRQGTSGAKLSGGEQQMLAIGRILRTGAKVLLLDEPTEGLAPVIVKQIGHSIAALKAAGYTVVLVEQNYKFATSICDHLVVIENGAVVDQIARDDYAASEPRIMEYLGV
jgi:branched-chain amino acid transport system ATP-binding protein